MSCEEAQTPLRVVIADDEPLGLARLRRLLVDEPGIELVGECTDGQSTVDRIFMTRPDLVFLDIAMPELDGFQVLERIQSLPAMAVIFVTAHDHFAVQAFEVNAVDYICKPLSPERLRVALGRARARIAERRRGREQAAGRLLPQAHPPPDTSAANGDNIPPRGLGPLTDRVAVYSNGRACIVKLEDIDYICSSDNYVELHVGRHTHLVRSTLGTLAGRLPEGRFIRISRSHLVNVERVREVRSRTHGDFHVVLSDGTKLPGTRSHRQQLAALLG